MEKEFLFRGGETSMAKKRRKRKRVQRARSRQNALWLRFVTVFVCVVAAVLLIGTFFLLQAGEKKEKSNDGGGEAASGTQGNTASAPAAGDTEERKQEASDAYQEFLEGKREVCLDNDEILFSGLESGKSYYLADLLQSVTGDMQQMHGGAEGWNTKIGKLQYAYLDCGKDGIEELALRFYGIDLYSADDDSDKTCVIVYEDGKLFLRYGYESWARSATTLYYYGYINGSGSGGAAHAIGEEMLLDASGKAHALCNWDIFWGSDIASMTPYYAEQYDISSMYRTAFGEEETETGNISLEYYVIGEEEYFIFLSEEEMGEKENQFVELCKQAGMRFVTAEELEQYTDMRIGELGLDKTCLEQTELTWQEVDNPAYAEYLRGAETEGDGD